TPAFSFAMVPPRSWSAPCKEEIPMSFVCCLIILASMAWSEDSGSKPQVSAAEMCLTEPVGCCFKDVSLQAACEGFGYLMCVKITSDDDAMLQARSEEGRHLALEEENVPFEQLLEKLLKPLGLTYGVNEKGIQIMIDSVVTPAPATQEDEDV